MSVGWGFDVHRFGGDPPVLLAGVAADLTRGLLGTSDADVVAHAVADALLGAAALGDLGDSFPPSDPRWDGADSMELLRTVVGRFHAEGLRVAHLDVTIVAESVRLTPVREAVRAALADVLGIELGLVSVKATTTDGLGFLGRDEGVAAVAVVTAFRPGAVS
ncbi:MAG: 2-C-methyl-D-erythritol 2,4-cyclodiphosphate synthase [Acidimicrobiia bacterium]|nr:2-C-methyl-D-erythritol 2,4-cyclodiphosphate synthase [Acidimicrobiia bacterium]MDH3398051.1 2-C-methyl-D-erythritol 2,4-cyclodiphosphate synthase [Acidimicrobiia bacterium]MDH5616133.1 2-C-methyl-D-erythritol 2,4-cyclodiphosphate synthase [Acidimicrobiia bacterium]